MAPRWIWMMTGGYGGTGGRYAIAGGCSRFGEIRVVARALQSVSHAAATAEAGLGGLQLDLSRLGCRCGSLVERGFVGNSRICLLSGSQKLLEKSKNML